jgi:hypothetical protein
MVVYVARFLTSDVPKRVQGQKQVGILTEYNLYIRQSEQKNETEKCGSRHG